jgi:phage terminase small subunit
MEKKRRRGRANGITARDEIFCQEYVKTFNQAEAAIAAGVTPGSSRARGCEWMKRWEVQVRIGEILSEVAERNQYDQDYVIQAIVDTIEAGRQAVPVLRKGNPVLLEGKHGEPIALVKMVDAGSVLKGSELLGKYHAMFTDKKQIDGTITLEQILAETE